LGKTGEKLGISAGALIRPVKEESIISGLSANYVSTTEVLLFVVATLLYYNPFMYCFQIFLLYVIFINMVQRKLIETGLSTQYPLLL
jgi:hypothetical protein